MRRIEALEVNCSEVEDLRFRQRYQDLGPAEAAALEGHLQHCALCRADGLALERAKDLLQAEEAARPDPLVQRRLQAALRQKHMESETPLTGPPWPRRVPVYQVVLGLAAVVLLAVALPRPSFWSSPEPGLGTDPVQVAPARVDSYAVNYKLHLRERPPHNEDSLLIDALRGHVGAQDSI